MCRTSYSDENANFQILTEWNLLIFFLKDAAEAYLEPSWTSTVELFLRK